MSCTSAPRLFFKKSLRLCCLMYCLPPTSTASTLNPEIKDWITEMWLFRATATSLTSYPNWPGEYSMGLIDIIPLGCEFSFGGGFGLKGRFLIMNGLDWTSFPVFSFPLGRSVFLYSSIDLRLTNKPP